MLNKISTKPLARSAGRFVVVASQYNARYVDSMLRAARAVLKRAGAKHVKIVRVPGAYEIPIVANRLARRGCRSGLVIPPHSGKTDHKGESDIDAIICLGVILRGETVHAAHIGEAISRALMEIQLRYEVPVIHEVLLLENEQQARARCLDPRHNRGSEAAQTALAMARVMRSLNAR